MGILGSVLGLTQGAGGGLDERRRETRRRKARGLGGLRLSSRVGFTHPSKRAFYLRTSMLRRRAWPRTYHFGHRAWRGRAGSGMQDGRLRSQHRSSRVLRGKAWHTDGVPWHGRRGAGDRSRIGKDPRAPRVVTAAIEQRPCNGRTCSARRRSRLSRSCMDVGSLDRFVAAVGLAVVSNLVGIPHCVQSHLIRSSGGVGGLAFGLGLCGPGGAAKGLLAGTWERFLEQ